MLILISLLTSCGDPPSHLEKGEWVLRGSGVVGHLSTMDGCEIAIWGDRWGTSGDLPIQCSASGDRSTTWIEFAIETSVGGGVGIIQTANDADWALLPLGSREGEWEVQLQKSVGSLTANEVSELASNSLRGREELAVGWSDGGLLLVDGNAPVGELVMRGDGVVEIEVYDEFWLTDGLQISETASVGPDLYLSFPVMPSFMGEMGGVIVNRVVGEVVVPLGESPTPTDRVLQLSTGRRSDEERTVLVERAKTSALERERSVLLPIALTLYEEHTSTLVESGSEHQRAEACTGWVETELWALQLIGYEVSFLMGDTGGCELWLEPAPVQHLRMLSIGIIDGQVVEKDRSR